MNDSITTKLCGIIPSLACYYKYFVQCQSRDYPTELCYVYYIYVALFHFVGILLSQFSVILNQISSIVTTLHTNCELVL